MAKGLGKGLASLFSEIEKESAMLSERDGANVVVDLPIDSVKPNPYQPRKYFDEEALLGLADSIRSVGLIQPIIVTESGNGYVIIAGERRYRACSMLGLKTIPCIVRKMDDRRKKEIAIIENLQRESLNPMEEAESLKELMEEYGLTQEELSALLGKSRSAIANILRLNNLSASVGALLRSGAISAGHARTLVSVKDEVKQLSLEQKCVVEKLSVHQLEELVSSLNVTAAKKARTKKARLNPSQKAFLYELQQSLNAKVKWLGDKEKGKFIIEYANAEELESLTKSLKKVL